MTVDTGLQAALVKFYLRDESFNGSILCIVCEAKNVSGLIVERHASPIPHEKSSEAGIDPNLQTHQWPAFVCRIHVHTDWLLSRLASMRLPSSTCVFINIRGSD
ncbi:MAG TPA: hypothetical protein DHV39_06155 [Verrucomicrobiales bacterium]|nr:hypothetical protein [Verrucomicrobiales bacterium]